MADAGLRLPVDSREQRRAFGRGERLGGHWGASAGVHLCSQRPFPQVGCVVVYCSCVPHFYIQSF